jgi:hypothetical protein
MAGYEIAQIARYYEQTRGRAVSYLEMKCNQFVVAVLQASVDARFPQLLANDFPSSPRFQKVDQPMPGDLVHWPGHIAVVLDPDKGDFIGSQTSTGVAISNYKQGYWHGQYGGKKPDCFLRYIG